MVAPFSTIPRRQRLLWVFGSYLGLTVVLTYPLITQMGSALPSDPGDPLLNTWLLWWNTEAMPLSERWWNPPFFYPFPDVLTFSENLLGLLPLSGPVQLVSGNPILAYNVAFLLSFPLSGTAAYFLARELTKREDISWVAGLMYGFSPHRVDQLAHLQVLSSYWLPIILLALHVYLRDGRMRWLVLFGAAYLAQGLSNGYMFLFVPVLVGLWILWFVPVRRLWRVAGPIVAAGSIAATVALPVLLRYKAVHDRLGFARSLGEMSFFSGDLTAVLSASSQLGVWGWLSWFHGPERQLFPGLTVAVVVLLSVVRLRWPHASNPPVWMRALRATLATASTAFLAIIVARLVWGPLALSLFGLDISVNQLDKPFSFAALFATMLALVSPVVVGA